MHSKNCTTFRLKCRVLKFVQCFAHYIFKKTTVQKMCHRMCGRVTLKKCFAEEVLRFPLKCRVLNAWKCSVFKFIQFSGHSFQKRGTPKNVPLFRLKSCVWKFVQCFAHYIVKKGRLQKMYSYRFFHWRKKGHLKNVPLFPMKFKKSTARVFSFWDTFWDESTS